MNFIYSLIDSISFILDTDDGKDFFQPSFTQFDILYQTDCLFIGGVAGNRVALLRTATVASRVLVLPIVSLPILIDLRHVLSRQMCVLYYLSRFIYVLENLSVIINIEKYRR